MSWICSAASTRDGTWDKGMRGAQSWAQEKGSRTVPSGTSQLQGGCSCLTKPHLQLTFPTQVGSREKLPLLFPRSWAERHGDELVAGSSFPKIENKGRQRCLFGLITTARNTCTLACPLHELLYGLLPHSRNESHLLSAFQRLPSLGNSMKKMTMFLFTLIGAKLALFETKPSRVTCSDFKALAHVAFTSLQTLIDYSRRNLSSCFDEFSARRQTWMWHLRWLQGKTLF